jgi:hypothetical protein
MGIEGHVWYTYLDRVIAQATWRNAFKKVVLDQTIAAPIYTATYIIGKYKDYLRDRVIDCQLVVIVLGTSILEGRISTNELTKDMKTNFLPMYLADCFVFIPVQLINFKYVSAYYRVPFMFSIAFIFNAFLSAYKHTDDEQTTSSKS